MYKQNINSIISFLLILLWVYAAISKLANFDQSRTQMLEQVFPAAFAEVLAWAVPLTELFTAALLIIPKTTVYGLQASLFLLLQFSIYIIAIISNAFGKIPCSCGGILDNMNWAEHLVFNLFFLLLTLVALIKPLEERRIMGKE